MQREYNALKDGAITLSFDGKPSAMGRIKIFLWNIVLFPMVKIKWEDKQDE